jgi:hypothetical protein
MLTFEFYFKQCIIKNTLYRWSSFLETVKTVMNGEFSSTPTVETVGYNQNDFLDIYQIIPRLKPWANNEKYRTLIIMVLMGNLLHISKSCSFKKIFYPTVSTVGGRWL